MLSVWHKGKGADSTVKKNNVLIGREFFHLSDGYVVGAPQRKAVLSLQLHIYLGWGGGGRVRDRGLAELHLATLLSTWMD